MRNIFLIFLFPLMIFSQDTILIGDVDCSGEVNSEDASLILQFVTNVIDELPCEANMTGLTPEQLQEMIDMMEGQLSINYAGDAGGNGVDILYPDGYGGEPITWNLSESYTVPDGKTLYITNYYSAYSSNYYLTINDIDIYRGYSNWDAYGGSHQPFVVNSGDVVSVNYDAGSFHGILENSSDVLGITWNLSESYTVPDGKTLYITNYYSAYSSNYYLSINDIEIYRGYSNWDAYGGSDHPFIVNSGEVISVNYDAGSFNGYLVDEDYFSSAASGSTSSNNVGNVIISQYPFPDGFQNLETVHHNIFIQGDYVVPEGKNLYITTLSAPQPNSSNTVYLLINNNPVCSPVTTSTDQQHQLKIPIIVGENEIISNSDCFADVTGCYDSSGNLVDEGLQFSYENNGTNCVYECMVEEGMGQFFLIDSENGFSDDCESELIYESPVAQENCGLVIHGYLVDKTVDVFHHDFMISENYVVSENQYVFIMFFQSTLDTFNSNLFINGELTFSDYVSGAAKNKKILPLIAGPNDIISCPIGGYIHGYLINE